MPLPPFFVVKYRLKILSRMSGGTPCPWSWTLTSMAYAVASGNYLELAAVGHGLHAVDDDVEQGLLDEIGVDANGELLGRDLTNDLHAVLRCVGDGEQGNIFERAAQIGFGETQLDGTGEIDERLHDAIEAPDLAGDDVQMAERIGLELGSFSRSTSR